MKQVEIQYFAALRERRGLAKEQITTAAKTYAALYERLSAEHGFALPNHLVKIAINGEFASLYSDIADGDSVVFLPPVAGG